MNPLRPASSQPTTGPSRPPRVSPTGKAGSAPVQKTGSEPQVGPTLQDSRNLSAQGRSSAVQSLGLEPSPDSDLGFPRWNFPAQAFPGFYLANQDRSPAYHVDKILKDLPQIWERPWSKDLPSPSDKSRSQETYGALFKRIAAETGTDPYALAAYCIFESYHSGRQSFNPRMQEIGGGMHAAGIAATQAQDWKGKKIPGTAQRFPNTIKATATVLRSHPEYGLRCLAAEFKSAYRQKGQDLAKTFPSVAYPAWKNPAESKGNYGTQAQYVSRAFALYQGFAAADQAR